MRTNALIPVIFGAVFSAAALAPQPLLAADEQSSPPEEAATVELNNGTAQKNAGADSQYETLLKQYQDDKSRSDAALTQYRQQLTTFEEAKDKNDLARQQYESQLKAYDDALAAQKKPD